MFRTKLIPATMAAVIALGTAGAVFANENDNSDESSAILNAKTSISQAIAAAETQVNGQAMRVDVRHEKDTYLYEIKVISKEKVSQVFVDAATGAVTRTEDEGLIAKVFDKEDQAEFAKLAGSPVTLATAIASAEKETGGKAIEAAYEKMDNKTQFVVEVAKDKTVQKVRVDSASGKVVKVSPSETGENNED